MSPIPLTIGRACRLACGCALLALTGCGSATDPHKSGADEPLVPVRGTVTLNGTPIPNGEVVFNPTREDWTGPYPRGKIEASGVYALRTADRPGAPVGTYRATIVLDDTKEVGHSFDPSYANKEKSPLVVEVVANKPPGGYDLPLIPRSSR